MQKKASSINILVIIFLGLTTAVANILSNLATSQLPLAVHHYLLLIWLFLVVVTFVVILLTVCQHHLQHALEQQELPSDVQRHYRMLRERVRSFWIRGLLEPSLEGVAFITLDLYERPDLLKNPWKPVLQEVEQVGRLLPSGTVITQVYDEAGGVLLILGEPGAGKTTLLLQLTHDLLERARDDETLPIPVVFSLSTWAAKRASLTEWCVEELSQKYHIPKKIGKVWVEKHRVLPLLDGYDEVAEECRAKCASAINAYLQGQGALLPIVIASRTTEYAALGTKVTAQRAVEVQPLTPRQIHAYLQGAQTQGEVLQVAFRDDAGFRALMKNPLMLSLLKKTYQGKQLQELAMGVSPEALRDQIFPAYVQHMLQRRRAEHCYTSEKTLGWLAWLATQMKQRGQHEFYLERLEVEWLTDRRPYQLYTSVAFGVISFLVAILVNSFLFSDPFKGSVVALLDGALALLFVWLIETGVHGGSSLFSTQRRFPFFTWSDTRSAGLPGLSSGVRRLLGDRLVYALFCGFLDGALVEGLVGPAYGLVHGLFYAAFYVVLGKLDRHIHPAEILTWSLTSVKRHAMNSVLQGIGIGFLLGIFNAVPYLSHLSTFVTTLSFGLCVGFAIGIVIMLMRGFTSGVLEGSQIVKPNQGIRNSLSNSLRLGLSSGLAFGGVIFLSYSLVIHSVLKVGYLSQIPLNSGLLFGISDGLAVAYLFWLINGGFASVQHFILRVRLWQTRCIPWRYPQFLDYAHERILLHKVGGGYLFKHELLLEYFAGLGRQAGTGVASTEGTLPSSGAETHQPAPGTPYAGARSADWGTRSCSLPRAQPPLRT